MKTIFTSLPLMVLLFALASCSEEPPVETADQAENKAAADNTADSAAPEAEQSLAEDWPFIWLDEDGDCQKTDVEVLIRDALNLIHWNDPEACTIRDGEWGNWATGGIVNGGSAWVVPVVTPDQAMKSGAESWGREQQLAFINDMDNLVVMDIYTAAERNVLGPESWLPYEPLRCTYIDRWVTIKSRYALSMSEAEQKTVQSIQDACSAEADG